MDEFTSAQHEAIKDLDGRLAVEIERLHALPRHADLSHALIKLESARRGLQDAVRKIIPVP